MLICSKVHIVRTFALHSRIFNLWRMRSEGYGSQFVCVCVCVSVCYPLAATVLIYRRKVRYHRLLNDCLSPLPFTLPEELSMDRRNSSGFFSRRRVCTLSDSFCRTTDSSLFSVNELLSFLACPVAYYHVLAGLAHVITLPPPPPPPPPQIGH